MCSTGYAFKSISNIIEMSGGLESCERLTKIIIKTYLTLIQITVSPVRDFPVKHMRNTYTTFISGRLKIMKYKWKVKKSINSHIHSNVYIIIYTFSLPNNIYIYLSCQCLYIYGKLKGHVHTQMKILVTNETKNNTLFFLELT